MGSITRFSSPFSLKVVVCGHCHVTLPQTMKETLTCLMAAAQDHVGGDRAAVEYTTHPPRSSSPSVQPAIFFPVSTARDLLPRQYSPRSSSPSVQPAIFFPVSTARDLLPRQYSPGNNSALNKSTNERLTEKPKQTDTDRQTHRLAVADRQ